MELASKYDGPTDQTYTWSDIENLTPNQIDQFSEIFGLPNENGNIELSRKEIGKILYYLGMIEDMYVSIMLQPGVVETLCHNMSIEEANNLRHAYQINIIPCRIEVNDRNGIINYLPEVSMDSVELANELENIGSDRIRSKPPQRYPYHKMKILTNLGYPFKNLNISLSLAIHMQDMDLIRTLASYGVNPRLHIHEIIATGNLQFINTVFDTFFKSLTSEILIQVIEALKLLDIKTKLQIVQIFIDAGVKINDQILLSAISGYHYSPELLRYLVSHTDNIKSVGIKVLHEAIMQGYPDIVEFLLESGVDPNGTIFDYDSRYKSSSNSILESRVERTPLGSAIGLPESKINMDIINTILKYGGEVTDHELKFVIDNPILFEYLLKNKYPNDVKRLNYLLYDLDDYTFMMEVYPDIMREHAGYIKENWNDIVPEMIEDTKKDYIEEINRQKIENSHAEILDYVLNSHNRQTTELVKILLENGADPNVHFGTGYPPILLAVIDGNYDVLKLLLEYGADPNIVYEGVNPLTRSASYGDLEAVKILLEGGANPNFPQAPVKKGYIGNHPWVYHGDKEYIKGEIIKILKQYGARYLD